MPLEHLHIVQVWVILRLVLDVHHVLVDMFDALVHKAHLCLHPVNWKVLDGFRVDGAHVSKLRFFHVLGLLPLVCGLAHLIHQLHCDCIISGYDSLSGVEMLAN